MRRTKAQHLTDASVRFAKKLWPQQFQIADTHQLRSLIESWNFSVPAGDIQLLSGKWYVTHSGLLRLARRTHCSGIQTEIVKDFTDPQSNRWVVKATVYQSARSRGFVGYGDAGPYNVSPQMHGAEMRIAETRAVNRALRKAYGIGLCSVEELGSGAGSIPLSRSPVAHTTESDQGNGQGNGEPRLRDRLLLLIREYQLDAEQVKRYATNFCGTEMLREASREQVEKLVLHLEQVAAQGREELLTELASTPETAPRPSPAPINKEAA